jgi:(p)ppGpp synthase/HD superfamily hydrolase
MLKQNQNRGGSMNDLLKRAESFARIRHMGQFRKGKAQEPYIIHLDEVAELVLSWNGIGNAIAADWLHDTVEDCPTKSFAKKYWYSYGGLKHSK